MGVKKMTEQLVLEIQGSISRSFRSDNCKAIGSSLSQSRLNLRVSHGYVGRASYKMSQVGATLLTGTG